MGKQLGFWNEGAARFLHNRLIEKGIRVEEFAEKLNVDQRTVRYWTRTNRRPMRPSVEHLPLIFDLLGVSLHDFEAAANEYERSKGEGSRQRSGDSSPSRTPSDALSVRISDDEGDSAPDVDQPGGADAHKPIAADVDFLPGKELHDGLASPRRRLLAICAAAAAILGIGVICWSIWSHSSARTQPIPPPVTFEIPAEVRGVYDRAFAGDVSPDGTLIAFLARAIPSMKRMLFVYSVSDRRLWSLPASEGNYTSFFWNSDSRSIFFIAKTDLMRISATGTGLEQVGYAGEAVKGAVNSDGVIVLGSRTGLLRVSGSGGAPDQLTRLGTDEVAHTMPSFLPDGDHVLFTITHKASNGNVIHSLAVVSLRKKSTRTLFELPSRARYMNGQLLYVRQGTLFARPFDVERLIFTGPERSLVSRIASDKLTGEAYFSVSESTLMVTPVPQIPPLESLTADGRVRTTISDPKGITYAAVRHTGTALVVVGRGAGEDVGHLWLVDLDGRRRVRLVADDLEPSSPVFSPDDRVVYYTDAGRSWGNIYALEPQASRVQSHPVRLSKDIAAPRDVTPDGRFLIFQRWDNRDGNIWYMPVGQPQAAEPFVATAEDEGDSARFSPDGKRVAFVAKRNGVYAVFVANFPPNGQLPKQAMEGDGWRARWSLDGRHIYFVRGRSIMEADPATRETRRLFDLAREISILEVAQDGGFFVRQTPIELPRTVVTQWWPRLAEHPLDLDTAR